MGYKITKKTIMIISISLVVFVMALGYATLNQHFDIDGVTVVEQQDVVEIEEITVSTTNGGINLVNSYSNTFAVMHVSLPNSNSTVTYTIKFRNECGNNDSIKLFNMEELSSDNSNIEYTITNTTTNSNELVMACRAETTSTITFRFKTGNNVDYSQNTKDLFVTYNFESITNGDVNEPGEITNSKLLRTRILTKYTPLNDSSVNFTYTSEGKSSDSAAVVAAQVTNGLYYTSNLSKTENGKVVYYFRGNVNNYVTFAGKTWRVVRINEDGTIRLVMVDSLESKYTYDSASPYNNIQYIGSPVETALNGFYTSDLQAYDSYIADSGFCNDTSVASTSGSNKYYGARSRLVSSNSPRFTCPVTKLTTSNGLTKKVGLLSLDEAVYAGAKYSVTNSSFYLKTGDQYWFMSPIAYDGTYSSFAVLISTGKVGNNRSNNGSQTVHPVINLIADIEVTEGEGTELSPWVIDATPVVVEPEYIYAYNLSLVTIGSSNISTLGTTYETPDSARSAIGMDYFLAYTKDSSNIIDAVWLVFTPDNGNNYYYLKGADTSAYADNINIMNAVYGTNCTEASASCKYGVISVSNTSVAANDGHLGCSVFERGAYCNQGGGGGAY